MTLITGVDASVFGIEVSRLVVLFLFKNIFADISCILRVTSNKTSEAFSSP